MSSIISKNLQVGTSGTATDNFTIFQPATPDGTLRIGNGNTGITTSQVAVTSAGNVGIGTSAPGAKLDVNGPASVTSFTGTTRLGVTVRGSTSTNDYSGIDFVGAGSNLTARIAVLSTGGGSYLSFGTSNVYASGITNTAMSIDPTGNLQFNSGYGSVATAYGCRAWVNFNGVGTVAIKASGNVSSITDSGVGDFTLNFTTAMPDANYAVTSAGTGAFGVNANIGGWYTGVITNGSAVPLTKTTSAVRVYSAIVGGPAGGGDSTENYFCIFR